MSSPNTQLIDWTSEPMLTRPRTVARWRSGEREIVSEREFQSEVHHLSTAEERQETSDRLRRLRRAS